MQALLLLSHIFKHLKDYKLGYAATSAWQTWQKNARSLLEANDTCNWS